MPKAEVELAPSLRPAVVVEWDNGRTGRILDDVVREEPLEIRLANERAALLMRTPGHDLELRHRQRETPRPRRIRTTGRHRRSRNASHSFSASASVIP